MAASPTWQPHEMRAKSTSTTTHDGDDSSILEHEYFKHSSSIDEDPLATLLSIDADLVHQPTVDKEHRSSVDNSAEAEQSSTVVASIEEPAMDYRTHASASSSSSYADPFAEMHGLPICTAPPSTMPVPTASMAAWDGGLVAQPYSYPAFDGPAYDSRDHYYQESMAAQHPQHMYSPQEQHPSPYSNYSREQSTAYKVYDQPEEDDYDEDLDGGEGSDPCYAQLLYRCLRDAPSHTLSLRELYKWVQAHSQKAKDSNSKGWQNSVRHNLSMNAAFERVPASSLQSPSTTTTTTAPKRGSLWRLTAHALAEGVISTTRYRKHPKRKPERRSIPAPKRQQSGAKGGQATREASARRRAMQARLQNRALRGVTSNPASGRPSPGPGMEGSWREGGLPYYLPQHPHAPPAPAPPPPHPHAHQQLHLRTTPYDSFRYATPTPQQTTLTPTLATPPQLPLSHPQQQSKSLFEEFELGHLRPEDRMLFGTTDSYGDMDGEVQTPWSETGSLFSEAMMGFGEVEEG